MTIEEVKQLKYTQELYHITETNRDGTSVRIRISGKVKIWKRNPNKVKVPFKYGLYFNGYIDEHNCSNWSLTDPQKTKASFDEMEKDLK